MKKFRQEYHFINENSANQRKMFTISKKLLNMQEVNDNLFLKLSIIRKTPNDGRIMFFVFFFFQFCLLTMKYSLFALLALIISFTHAKLVGRYIIEISRGTLSCERGVGAPINVGVDQAFLTHLTYHSHRDS